MKKEYIEPTVRVQEIMGSELMEDTMSTNNGYTVTATQALSKESSFDEFDDEE